MSTDTSSDSKPAPRGLALLGPGLLVAATGVGAGDLATGAFAGGKLGLAVLWAVVLGAAIKFVLNEGLARWQLATDSTVLEGTRIHFGRIPLILFFGYLCLWSLMVGGALMGACGVAAHAILDLTGKPETDKQIYGILHSVLAVILVWRGGYRLFETAMRICIGVMFVTVLVAAVAAKPDWGSVLAGLLVPTIPELTGDGLKWTIGLMGGVGGTVTVLCYGYWIREENRSGLGELRTCRLDLMTGYLVTAVFGICMVILGSQVPFDTEAKPASLVIDLANNLSAAIGGDAGRAGKAAFLIGAWGAIASSMLGVWQSVPYLFVDSWRLIKTEPAPADESPADQSATAIEEDAATPKRHPIDRGSLIAIATLPAITLFLDFKQVQITYAVVGAAFMPLLAIVLVVLNGRESAVGSQARNSKATTVVLIGILAFFTWASFYTVRGKLFPKEPKDKPAQASGGRKSGGFRTHSELTVGLHPPLACGRDEPTNSQHSPADRRETPECSPPWSA